MPGFIDVSHMSNEEVRRMGHADDYDDEPTRSYQYRYQYSNKSRRPEAPKPNYTANDVWAAACAAQRINGTYVKVAVIDEQNLKTNRKIVEELLADTTKIAQEDREQGDVVRRYFKALTFKVLEGRTLSDYMRQAMVIAEKETITSTYDLATVISLPATYEKSSKRDELENRIKWARGGYVGMVSEKVELKIEVVKKLWSDKWNTWYITGVTPEDQVVFFAFKRQVEIGDTMTITGKVKAQRDTSTQLSHVKEIV
jgi:hypothetical protein